MKELLGPSRAAHEDAYAHLAAIVDSSFDAIISKDLDSVILSWNRAAEQLFEWSAEEAVGQSIRILIPDHLMAEETHIIERIRGGERVDTFETARRRKGGTLVPVSLTVSPIKNARGEIIGASKIARDITATKESERRIRLLLMEVNHRVKNQFAVILSMVRETLKHSGSPRDFERAIRERIMALSRSHDLLVESDWAGTSLFSLIQEHLKPFGHEDRIVLNGPLLTLQPLAAQYLGIAFHELGTNSAKYGALSSGSGNITVNWHVVRDHEDNQHFTIEWEETSVAAPHILESGRSGFGGIILERVTPEALSGSSILERRPGYAHWSLTAPFANSIVPSVA